MTTLAALQNALKDTLSPKRYTHSLGVQNTARELAQRYQANVQQAEVAGLLHDCARELSSNLLLKRADEFGIVYGSLEHASPVLLHAPISARVAAVEYGIEDPDILRAIALHTTGSEDMSTLDKIIFLADFIEPSRDYPGVNSLRKLAVQDLERAVLAAFDQTLGYLVREQMVIHPASVAGRNALLMQLAKNVK